MNTRQQLTKLIKTADAQAIQCSKDGREDLAKMYRADAVKLAKEVAEIDAKRMKELMAK
jgi:hypothetical protein